LRCWETAGALTEKRLAESELLEAKDDRRLAER